VVDEPSLGEVSRRIDHVTMSLTQLVQRTEYTADRRYDDRRFAELESDVAELRRQLAEDLKALRQSIDAATEKRGTNVRQAVFAGLLPALFMMVSIVVQIWLAAKGGS
jgi:hypothetical protein